MQFLPQVTVPWHHFSLSPRTPHRAVKLFAKLPLELPLDKHSCVSTAHTVLETPFIHGPAATLNRRRHSQSYGRWQEVLWSQSFCMFLSGCRISYPDTGQGFTASVQQVTVTGWDNVKCFATSWQQPEQRKHDSSSSECTLYSFLIYLYKIF